MSVVDEWFADGKRKRNASPDKLYALDIVGIRHKAWEPNSFTDTLICRWFESKDREVTKSWCITTTPGVPWLLNPMQRKGAAILVSGQYTEAYALGRYKGKDALLQVAPVKVYRDRNRNSTIDLDPDTIEEGLFGIHIHRAGIFSKLVGTWSAGCQVFEKEADFEDFIEICRTSLKYWGNSFTYTLVEI